MSPGHQFPAPLVSSCCRSSATPGPSGSAHPRAATAPMPRGCKDSTVPEPPRLGCRGSQTLTRPQLRDAGAAGAPLHEVAGLCYPGTTAASQHSAARAQGIRAAMAPLLGTARASTDSLPKGHQSCCGATGALLLGAVRAATALLSQGCCGQHPGHPALWSRCCLVQQYQWSYCTTDVAGPVYLGQERFNQYYIYYTTER